MFTILLELMSSALCYIGYIKSNSFLQPLNSKDEAHYISLLADKDIDARNQLIEHNLRLVAHIVKKYDIKKEQREDLISIGTIGLIKAVDSFKPEKGHKLTTYASRCIENEILMYLRSAKHYFQNVSLNDAIAQDKDGSEITLLDAIASPCDKSIIDHMMLVDNIEKLNTFIHVLDARELSIITKRFGLYGKREQTQREIASEMHISRSYVSRIEKRAFMKIYREFKKQEKKG
ncbi:MAG: RNA polymerase sporulation sigma factor SigK [Erysipelotrichaceae bacterium]